MLAITEELLLSNITGPFGALILACVAIWFLVRENSKAANNINAIMERFITLTEKQIAAQESINNRLANIESKIEDLDSTTGKCLYAVDYCRLKNGLTKNDNDQKV